METTAERPLAGNQPMTLLMQGSNAANYTANFKCPYTKLPTVHSNTLISLVLKASAPKVSKNGNFADALHPIYLSINRIM